MRAAVALRSVTLRTWAARLLPWAFAIAVFVALLRRYDPDEILRQMRAGAWGAMLPFPFVLPFVYLVAHGWADTLVYERVLGGGLGWRDVVRGRAGTAILMLLGYAFGHGGMGVWLARRTGASAASVGGAVLYGMGSDLASVGLVTTAATWIGGADVPKGVRIVALASALVPIALALAGPTLLARTRASFVAPWRAIDRRVAMGQILLRATDIALVVVFAWAAARAFGMPIPLAAFATYMPVVLLAMSLPLSVAGFGAAQAAWLVFLPWARGEQILAFQLLWQVAMGLGTIARGVPFVGGVVREIRDARALQRERPSIVHSSG